MIEPLWIGHVWNLAWDARQLHALTHVFGYRRQPWVRVAAKRIRLFSSSCDHPHRARRRVRSFMSIGIALANPDAHGWAYEPNPLTFAFLQSNLAANGVAHRVCVTGDQTQDLSFACC